MSNVLSKAQWHALVRLGEIDDGMYLKARGHLRAACGRLVNKGYARHHGDDGFLSAIFSITSAGRAALKSGSAEI